MNLNFSSQGNFWSHFSPLSSWLAIIGLFLVAVLGSLAGAGKLVNLVFPLGAFIIAIFLYLRSPILYVGFTWWIWFLSPIIRRLADNYSSFSDPSPILLAPLLVTFVSVATLCLHLPNAYQQGGLPIVLCVVGVVYGFIIGLIQSPSSATVIEFLRWVTPILFGFHLFVNWRYYPQYRQNLQRIFLWGVIVMGAYGICQYLMAPQWDVSWLSNLGRGGVAFGEPRRLGIRVWSTMNSPQPFAGVMMAGLILLLSIQGKWIRFPALGMGYLSFLLSLARSGWLSWIVALFIYIPSLKSNLQIRLIVGIIVAAVFIVPIATLDPFSQVIGTRIESMLNSGDDSFEGRLGGYADYTGLALSQAVGNGLGSEITFGMGQRDSGILTMFYSLGWIGSGLYLVSIVSIFLILLLGAEMRYDAFASASRAIALGCFSQMGLNIATAESIGLVLWTFTAMGLAALKYHRYQVSK